MIPPASTLAFVSGKGGVGKSLATVNLAETLVAQGYRVAVLDADLGQAATPVLFNETPPATVLEVVEGRALWQGVFHTTARGLTLVVGAGRAVPAAAEARLWQALDAALDHLRTTHDFVLIDAPAGLDRPVRWALDHADLGLLVLVGEPTAIADAYQLTKLVWHANPTCPLAALVNAADFERDAESVAARFSLITERFLGVAMPLAGWLPYSAAVRQSVRNQEPVVRTSDAMRLAFEALALTLLEGAYRHPAAPEPWAADSE